MTVLQGALEPGAPAPGSGGEQIRDDLGADAPVAGTVLMRSESAGRVWWCSWRGFPDDDLAGA